MSVATEIEARLTEVFSPTRLDVVNESYKHKGHAGDDGSGESHFHVAIRAPGFADLSRLARHRAVHQALGAELVARIHALSLDIDS